MHKAPISFWLTDKGRRIAGVLMCGASTTLFAANYVPHTVLLNYFKDHMHLYRCVLLQYIKN